MKSIKNALHTLPLLLVLSTLLMACGGRQSEEAQGRETELSGDEPDETAISETATTEYNPSDTVVNIRQEELPTRLQNHLLVVVNAYLDIGEAFMNDDEEEVKAETNSLIQLMERHEQENLDMPSEVRDFYTQTAHVIRQSGERLLELDGLEELRTSYSAMGPAVYKMARLTEFEGQKLYYHFCPDSFDGRGAYWLSRSAEINNPFAMQDDKACGETVASL